MIYGNAVAVKSRDEWTWDEWADLADMLDFNVRFTARHAKLRLRNVTFFARSEPERTIIEWRGHA